MKTEKNLLDAPLPAWASHVADDFGNVACGDCGKIQASSFEACIYCCTHPYLEESEDEDDYDGADNHCGMIKFVTCTSCGREEKMDANEDKRTGFDYQVAVEDELERRRDSQRALGFSEQTLRAMINADDIFGQIARMGWTPSDVKSITLLAPTKGGPLSSPTIQIEKI